MLRLGGLASGMDTDSMVKQLMKAESIKVDRLKQDRQVIEWRQQLYNEINKDFANFILKAREAFEYKNRRSSGGDWAVKTTVSNEDIASVTAQRGAVEGNHSITVESLAEGVKGGSDKTIEITDNIGAMSVTINGVEIKTKDGDTITEFVNAINSATGVLRDEDGNIVKDEEGKDVIVGTGVKASYDAVNKRFFIQSMGMGEKYGKIDIEVDSEGKKFFNDTLDLRLSKHDNGNTTYEKVELTTGKKNSFEGIDAKISYNGLEMTQGSNDFRLNGMDIKLKDTGKININISKDNDEALKRVKEFVEEYNKLIDKLSGLMGEKVNRDFKPLTDEQKEVMSEKEQELWEEKAKSGLVRNDSYINNTLSNMRTDIYKNVEGLNGVFKNITEIGITTQQYKSGAVGGKLQIDEDKLRKALNEDFDGVMELLFKEDSENAIKDDSKLTASELAAKRSNSGIITRIFDNMIVGMKDIIHKSGTGKEGDLFREVRSNMLVDFTTSGGRYSGKGSISDMDDELFKFDKKLDDLNVLLYRREQAYYAKFTAMEKAMQRMSSQSGWLSQQLGG